MTNRRTSGERLKSVIVELTIGALVAGGGCNSKPPPLPTVPKPVSPVAAQPAKESSEPMRSTEDAKPAAGPSESASTSNGKSKKVALRILEPPPEPLFPPSVGWKLRLSRRPPFWSSWCRCWRRSVPLSTRRASIRSSSSRARHRAPVASRSFIRYQQRTLPN